MSDLPVNKAPLQPAVGEAAWAGATRPWSDFGPDDPPGRPLGIEMRHLAALEALARERSFRDAATTLGYVQSAVSHQLATVERMLGARLVDRARGNAQVTLTEAGEVMLEHAREILEQFRTVQAKLNALSEGHAGTLRVGAFQSIANNLLPRVVPLFLRTHPKFRVVPTETSSDTPLFPLLESGALDVAFCELPGVEGPFEGIELMEDPFVLLVPSDSELAAREDSIAPSDIEDLPLIGFNDSRAQSEMLSVLRGHGLAPRFAFRSNMNATAQSLVAEGLGVAIVPYLTVDPLHPGTTVLEVETLPTRKIWLIWHRDRAMSAAVVKFIEITRATCPRFRGSRG